MFPSRPERSLLPRSAGACFAASLLVTLAFLVASVGRSGIWDPHELDRAELARRIAINVFGADSLRLQEATNSLPTLTDLGSGELGYTSMAWGLSTFGLHDWAGRLPLSLWAVAGALTLYLFLARMVTPRAGLYGVIALCTMPLYFMQARTMLGDVVTMAAATMCFCGWAAVIIERRSGWTALGWLSLGCFGAICGYLSRGAIVGVAAPSLGVGLAWLVLATSSFAAKVRPTRNVAPNQREAGTSHQRRALAMGVFALLLGTGALLVGLDALADAGANQPLARSLGMATVAKPPLASTFDLTVRELGHALFPWSAFLPFAFGRLMRMPGGSHGDDTRLREISTRVFLLVGAAVSYASFALLAPHVAPLPFAAPALLAAIAAVTIADFERGAPTSAALGAGTMLLGLVLWRDFVTTPVRALSAFSLAARDLPKGMDEHDGSLFSYAALVFFGLVLLAWWGYDADRARSTWRQQLRERLESYQRIADELQRVWAGNLVFGFLVIEAALVGLGAMLLIGRRMGWASVVRMPHTWAYAGLNAWWSIPLLLLAIPIGIDALRLAFAALLRALGLERAGATVVAALIAGALLCFGYYPALANQLSPKDAFESYSTRHGAGEPLGLLGLRARAARYYSGGDDTRRLTSPMAALTWLNTGRAMSPPQRRWLVLKRKDLAELNALHRQTMRTNLPVVDADTGEILLASSDLAGAKNHNPLSEMVFNAPPDRIQRPVEATFDDKLQALGWEVRDQSDKLVDWVVPGSTYTMRIYYRVQASMTRGYRSFIHIDGYQRRHNGDHEVLGGAYRMRHWRPGDVIADSYEMTLEPNFLPGQYTVYFGFFSGKQRLEVSAGKHHDNRVNGGVLVVK
jgi:4-amino-4-deoxy-L-arabinose transferase-like glycosyltransferase